MRHGRASSAIGQLSADLPVGQLRAKPKSSLGGRVSPAWLLVALAACAQTSPQLRVQRAAMVRSIDEAAPAALRRAASFRRALEAVGAVRREDFVTSAGRSRAYEQRPQPIGYDQTISNPYIVAIMTAAADAPPDGRVLEIGTGSGYQAAVLSRLTGEVYSIEIVEPLARSAQRRLRRLGYGNVHVRAGDGFAGWPEAAPFDAIVVTAGAASAPSALLGQLRPGGRLVMPIGPSTVQERLVVFTREADGGLSRCILGSAMFVPLTGRGARPVSSAGLTEKGIGYCFGEDAGRWDFEPAPESIRRALESAPKGSS